MAEDALNIGTLVGSIELEDNLTTSVLSSTVAALDKADVAMDDLNVSTKALGGSFSETSDKAKNLGTFIDRIDAEVKQLRGDQQAAAASGHALAFAVDEVGGASRLTASQLDRVQRELRESLSAYKALGKEAPESLNRIEREVRELANAQKTLTGGGAGGGSIPAFRGELNSLVGSYLSLAAGIGAVTSLGRMWIDFAQSSIESFASAEAAAKKVDVALQSQGNATQDLIDDYSDLATETQRLTAFSDDAAQEAQALFIQIGNVGPGQMKRATEAASNLAAGLGLELTQAATLVSKALEGNIASLQRYGIRLDKSRIEAEGADYVFAQLNSRFGGQAQAQLDTYAGKVQHLANSWDNVKEAVGGMLVGNEITTFALNRLDESLVRLDKQANESSFSLSKFWSMLPTGDNIGATYIAFLEDYLSLLNQIDKMASGSLLAKNIARGTAAAVPPPPLTATLPRIDARGMEEFEKWNIEVAAAKKETTAFARALDDLAGKKEMRELSAISTFWQKLPDDIQRSSRETDLILKQYMDLAPKLRTVPESAKATVAELNKMAIDRGLFAEPFEAGAIAVENLGEEVNLFFTDLKGLPGEIKAVEDAFVDLIKMEQAAARDRTGAGELLAGLQMPPEAMGQMQLMDRSMDLVIARDKKLQDTLRKSALDTTSYQVSKVIEAGEATRRQLGLTDDAYAAINDSVVIDIAEIISQQDNWTGTLDHVIAQLEAVGIAVPEDELRKLIQLMIDGANQAPEMSQGIAGIASSFSVLSTGIVNLSHVSEGSFGAIAKGIGTIAVSFDNAFSSFLNFKDNFINPKTGEAFKGVGLQMGISLAGGIVSGITSLFSAPMMGTNVKNSLMSGILGAGSGAAIGGMLASAVAGGMTGLQGGIFGAVGGFIVGALVGYFRGREVRAIMRQVGNDWGREISQGIAESIKEGAAMFGGSLQASELWNMDKILAEKPISASSFFSDIGKLHDVFSMLETKQMDAAQAATVLDKNFRTFVDFLGGRATPELKEIIRLNDTFGTQSKAIAEYTSQAASQALSGLSGFITARGQIVDELAEAEEKLGKASGRKEIAAAREEVEKLQRQLETLPLTDVGGEAMGSALMGVFSRRTMNGEDAIAVLKEMEPVVDSLTHQLVDLGLGGGAAFDQLRGMVALATDEIAGPALSGIGSLVSGVEGLNNANLLTGETFGGLASQVAAMVEGLEGEGKTAKQIYPLIGGYLQTLWELQQDNNFAIDDRTQKMLDEAEAAGVVGEAHRSAQEIMLQATLDMRDAVVGLAEVFGVVLPGDMADAARASEGYSKQVLEDWERIHPEVDVKYNIPKPSVPQIPDQTVDVRYRYQDYKPGQPPGYNQMGGLIAPSYYEGGGAVGTAAVEWKPKGTDVVPAMLSPGEFVLNTEAVKSMGVQALDVLNKQGGKISVKVIADTTEAMTEIMALWTQAPDTFVITPVLESQTAQYQIGLLKGSVEGIGERLRELPTQQPFTLAADTTALDTLSARIEDLPRERSLSFTAATSGLPRVMNELGAIPESKPFSVHATGAGIAELTAELTRLPESQPFTVQASVSGFSTVTDTIKALPEEKPFTINVSQTGLQDVSRELQAVPESKPFIVQASATGLESITGSIQTIPEQKPFSVVASAPSLQEVTRSITSLPANKPFTIEASVSGLSTVSNDLKTIPDEKPLDVCAYTSGIPEVTAELQKLPEEKPFTVQASVSGLETVHGEIERVPESKPFTVSATTAGFQGLESNIDTLPEQKPFTLAVTSTGLEQVTREIETIPSEKPFDVAATASGLPMVMQDIRSIPDAKTFEVQGQSTGLSGIVSQIQTIPEAKPFEVSATSTGLPGIMSDIRSVPDQKPFEVSATSTGLPSIMKDIRSVPDQKPFEVQASSTGLPPILSDIRAVPSEKPFEVRATSTGLPPIMADIRAVPDRKPFEVAATSTGLPPIMADIRAVPSEKPFEVRASSTGLPPIMADIRAVPDQKPFEVVASSVGLPPIMADIRAVPDQKPFEVRATSTGLPPIMADIRAVPDRKPFEVVASSTGLPLIMTDIRSIPDRKPFEVQAFSTGLPPIMADIRSIPETKPFTVVASSTGFPAIMDAIAAIPEEKPFTVTSTIVGVEVVIEKINTIPVEWFTVTTVTQTGVDEVIKKIRTIPTSTFVDVVFPPMSRINMQVDAIIESLGRIPTQINVDVNVGDIHVPKPPKPDTGTDDTPIGGIMLPPQPMPYPSPGTFPNPMPYPSPPIGSIGGGGGGGSIGTPGTGGFGPAGGSGTYHLAFGGDIPEIPPFKPMGTDTVPAMLTPREGVLNTAAMQVVTPQRLTQWNNDPSSIVREWLDRKSDTGAKIVVVVTDRIAHAAELDRLVQQFAEAEPLISANRHEVRSKIASALGVK